MVNPKLIYIYICCCCCCCFVLFIVLVLVHLFFRCLLLFVYSFRCFSFLSSSVFTSKKKLNRMKLHIVFVLFAFSFVFLVCFVFFKWFVFCLFLIFQKVVCFFLHVFSLFNLLIIPQKQAQGISQDNCLKLSGCNLQLHHG